MTGVHVDGCLGIAVVLIKDLRSSHFRLRNGQAGSAFFKAGGRIPRGSVLGRGHRRTSHCDCRVSILHREAATSGLSHILSLRSRSE